MKISHIYAAKKKFRTSSSVAKKEPKSKRRRKPAEPVKQQKPRPREMPGLSYSQPVPRFIAALPQFSNPSKPRKRRALELFAGSASWGKAMSAQGWDVHAFDIVYNSNHDILLPGECDRICNEVRQRKYHAVHLGTECTTWSQAAKPAYRDSAHLLGFPSLPDHKKQKVIDANKMAEISAKILEASHAAGIYCSLENPWASMLWLHPHMKRLQGFKRFRVDYCRWGARWRKSTGIFTNRPYVEELARVCTGKHKHIVLMGSLCKKANKYPAKLVKAWAELVDKHEG